jgi:hypothetical protein
MATGLHTLVPWLQPFATELVNVAAAAGLAPRVSSARRSHSQQALLYRRFLAGQSRFPAAPPGNSSHEIGLAFDLWINDESQFDDLGSVWESWGGIWGGHFHDPIHFEGPGVDRTTVVEDPGVPQPQFVDQLNAVLNTAVGLAAPWSVMGAQEVITHLPGSIQQGSLFKRALRPIVDPIGNLEDPWKDVANWILRTYQRF